MALRTPLSVTPHLYMGDSTGRPLDMGTVYFGEQDKDPEFYPITLYSDDALTKPLAQPVHTKGGYLYDKGDMVEPHAKELIYSVKVLDSYGRKVFYKGAMMRNSWNDDVIEQINAAIVASTDIARQIATDITNDAINNTAVEGGVLADTFVTATANAAGSVPRTQRDINSQFISIADFGGNLTAAGEWIKQSTSNYCYLEAGKTYTYTGTGEVYFNRFLCRDGQATVIIPEGISLLYSTESKTSPDIVHIENIKYVVYGHRIAKDVATNADDFLYKSRLLNTPVKSLFMKNIEVLALADPEDLDSWEDNINESRMDNFISYSVIESSHLENITMYGVAMLGNIATVNPDATHTEINIKMYNAETGYYLMPASGLFSVGMWSVGVSKNIFIINKPENQTYWVRKNRGIQTNGKDCIMCEADHSVRYDVDTVVAKYPLERSAYIMSSNAFVSNTYDLGGSTGVGMKSRFKIAPNSVAHLSNVLIKDTTDTSAIMPAYGYEKLSMSNLEIDSKGLCAVLTSLGKVEIDKIDVTGVMAFIRAYGADSNHGQSNATGDFNIGSIEVNNAVLRNVGGPDIPSIYSAAYDITVDEVHLSNIKVVEGDLWKKHFSEPIGAGKTKRMYINNVEGYGRSGVVGNDAITEYIEILNSRFNIIDANVAGATYAQLLDSYSSKASVFDFTVIFKSKKENLKTGYAKVHHKKETDTGLVKIADHWKSVEIVIDTVQTASYLSVFKTIGHSFEFEMYFNGEILKGFYNHKANTTTTVQVSGDALNTASASPSKIRLYFDTGVWKLTIGDSTGWTGGKHQLRIVAKRF